MRPELWGPRRPFPPLNSTRSAPRSREPPEVLPRRELRGGIDHDRQSVSVADIDDRLQRRRARGEMRTGEIEDRGGAVGDRGLDLPGKGLEQVAGLDHSSTGQLDRDVVRIALSGKDHDVSTLGRLRVPHVPPGRDQVVTGDACERGKEEAGGRTARHVSRLVAGQLGDTGRDRELELEHVDEAARRFGHRRRDLGRQH